MLKRKPPFRAEHVGSLLRPQKLRAAHRDHAAGKIPEAAFIAIQDDCIREVVAIQEDIGLQAINDGEFRRASYWSHFVEGTEGLRVAQARFDFHNDAESTHFLAPQAYGKLRRAAPISGAEFDFLQSVTSRTAKVTLPSPPTMHFWAGPDSLREAGYDLDGFIEDLARVYREEIADLYARGLRYLQIDEVPLAMLCDENIRASARARGESPEALVDKYIGLINSSLADIPADMTVAMHLCRGNFKGLWLSQGSYRHIAEKLFNEVRVDAYFLEYDTPRAGDFQPLAALPADKMVVLGLVSSKLPEMENPDTLCRRIDEAAKFTGLDQLALSPQCGFASAVSGNPITLDHQIAKLKLVVDTAARVWS